MTVLLRTRKDLDIDAEAELLKVAAMLCDRPAEAQRIREMVDIIHARINLYRAFIRKWTNFMGGLDNKTQELWLSSHGELQ